jgi:hypothetical protein
MLHADELTSSSDYPSCHFQSSPTAYATATSLLIGWAFYLIHYPTDANKIWQVTFPTPNLGHIAIYQSLAMGVPLAIYKLVEKDCSSSISSLTQRASEDVMHFLAWSAMTAYVNDETASYELTMPAAGITVTALEIMLYHLSSSFLALGAHWYAEAYAADL